MWDRSRKRTKKRGAKTPKRRELGVHPIECCQKDERMDCERQDGDDMSQVCVARHKMKV